MQGFTMSNNAVMLALLHEPRAYTLYMYLLYLSRMDYDVITKKQTRNYTRKKGQYIGSFNDLSNRLGTKFETLKKCIYVLENVGIIECIIQNKSNITINVFENLTTPKNGIVENLTTPKNGIVENLTTPKNGIPTTPKNGIPTTPKNGVLNNNTINKNTQNKIVVVKELPKEKFSELKELFIKTKLDYVSKLTGKTQEVIKKSLDRIEENHKTNDTFGEDDTLEKLINHMVNFLGSSGVKALCLKKVFNKKFNNEPSHNRDEYDNWDI